MSSFKDLAQIKTHSTAKKVWESVGPLGLVTVVQSPSFHYLPDLSLNFPVSLPEQKAIFIDGNSVGAINRFDGAVSDLGFMAHRTVSLAYRLVRDPEVLIIGGGGGTEILNARYHKARSISVVEMNREIVRLLQGPYGEFSGHIYDPSSVRIYIEDGRGFLERKGPSFDLIHLGLVDAHGASQAGVYSLRENYLLTREGIKAALKRLKPEGLLSISSWIKIPPNEGIKLMATLIEAVEELGGIPAESLVIIRSWQTATFLIKQGRINEREIARIKDFCRYNSFDMAYYPGITREETNIFHQLDECPFYLAAGEILGAGRQEFYQRYPFQIRPATDNRPFFAHYFKPENLVRLLGPDGRIWLPYLDSAYVLVWVAGGILLILSLVCILAPLPLLRIRLSAPGVIPTFFYFSFLGLAYMLIEMAFLQKFVLFLYNPIFSAALVISSFLICSGLGSLAAEHIRWEKTRVVRISIMLICFSAALILAGGKYLLPYLAPLPLGIRMAVLSLIIFPLAFPMGMLFPTGLKLLKEKREELIPWAWGINGFFSVLASATTVILTMAWGFRMVIILALGLYILAGLALVILKKDSGTAR